MNKKSPVRVLVVDDSADLRATLRSILEFMGYEIAGEAWDGNGAIKRVQQEKPDIIVMDVAMPGMDGITAARKIQATRPTPIVLLTAHDTPSLIERARDAGVGAYLVKPPDANGLNRAIILTMARFRELLELNRLNRELRRVNQELQKRNQQLQGAMKTIKTLSGLVPVCAWCGRKIQGEDGHWVDIETYIEQHSEAEFTHGICPECLVKFNAQKK